MQSALPLNSTHLYATSVSILRASVAPWFNSPIPRVLVEPLRHGDTEGRTRRSWNRKEDLFQPMAEFVLSAVAVNANGLLPVSRTVLWGGHGNTMDSRVAELVDVCTDSIPAQPASINTVQSLQNSPTTSRVKVWRIQRYPMPCRVNPRCR